MGARNAQEKDAADLSGVQRLPLKIALAIRGFLYFHTNASGLNFRSMNKMYNPILLTITFKLSEINLSSAMGS